jgi:hypothetical protein
VYIFTRAVNRVLLVLDVGGVINFILSSFFRLLQTVIFFMIGGGFGSGSGTGEREGTANG